FPVHRQRQRPNRVPHASLDCLMLKSSFLAEHLECKDQYWEQSGENEDNQVGTELQWTGKDTTGSSPQLQVFLPRREKPGRNRPHDGLPLICRRSPECLRNDTG